MPKAVPTTASVVDQLLEALKQDSITEALGAAIAPFLALSVQEIINKELGQTHKQLTADNKTLKNQVQALSTENVELKTRLTSAEERLDTLDRESRGKNIIIRGLPEGSYAERAGASNAPDDSASSLSVTNTVLKLFSEEMGVTVDPKDVTAAFRMKAGPRDTARSIMIKFDSAKTKEAVIRAKKHLHQKKSQVYISEHLTKAAAERFARARALVRVRK